MSKLINLIAKIDEKRAITLISQLPETDILGLYGLDIMGIPLRFINTKLRINECIIDHLSMHYDDYSDFRENFHMTYCTINTLDISLKLNQWQSKVLKEREIREMLNNARIAVDNLNIKFV